MRLQGRHDMKLQHQEAPDLDKQNFFTTAFEKEQIYKPFISKFEKVIKKYPYLHTVCIVVLAFQFFNLIFSFALFPESKFIAFQLSTLFFTSFSYAIFRFYLRSIAKENLVATCNDLISSCKEQIGYQEGNANHHIFLSDALYDFACFLESKEYTYYAFAERFSQFNISLKNLSCWMHWKYVHLVRETLLLYAIQERVKIVKYAPSRLDVHADLANSYIALSTLYVHPAKLDNYDENLWYPKQRFETEFQDKYYLAAEKAIEELKILNDYAPNEPWIHMQLAYSYSDLQMVEEEIQEYEIILKLVPNDQDTLFRLGVLYFQQGKNAKGLRVYENLKKVNYKKAEDLIWFYGSCQI